jgi:hypothetical protein
MFFLFKTFAPMLAGKEIIIQTDHQNLLWMENNQTPIVIRWRIYMQSFMHKVQLIPGKKMGSRMYSVKDIEEETYLQLFQLSEEQVNELQLERLQDLELESTLVMPDFMVYFLAKPYLEYDDIDSKSSCLCPINPGESEPEQQPAVIANNIHPPEYYIQQVHGGRKGHWGQRKTWSLLHVTYPGHNIPYEFVVEFVKNCPNYQKNRLDMADGIEPLVKHLKPEHHRQSIGIDHLSISPVDRFGNEYLTVIVDFFSKHAALYASATITAEQTAENLFSYYTTFGTFDQIFHDPGSAFESKVVKLLNQWIGIEDRVSLVNRHQSCGVEGTNKQVLRVEGTNKQVLRHLRTLITDERMITKWSHPSILKMVEFILIPRAPKQDTSLLS